MSENTLIYNIEKLNKFGTIDFIDIINIVDNKIYLNVTYIKNSHNQDILTFLPKSVYNLWNGNFLELKSVEVGIHDFIQLLPYVTQKSSFKNFKLDGLKIETLTEDNCFLYRYLSINTKSKVHNIRDYDLFVYKNTLYVLKNVEAYYRLNKSYGHLNIEIIKKYKLFIENNILNTLFKKELIFDKKGYIIYKGNKETLHTLTTNVDIVKEALLDIEEALKEIEY